MEGRLERESKKHLFETTWRSTLQICKLNTDKILLTPPYKTDSLVSRVSKKDGSKIQH